MHCKAQTYTFTIACHDKIVLAHILSVVLA